MRDKTIRTSTVEAAILRDREQRQPAGVKPANTIACFGCKKPFVYRGPRGDNSGRFCSNQCRIEYDCPGAFSFDPFKVTRWRAVAGSNLGYLVATPMTRVSGRERDDGKIRGGWQVECRGCGKPFESLGWAYCSKDCKRAVAEHAEAKALMVKVGIDAPAKRKCLECGGNIPNWRNGKRVSKATLFCLPKCGQRYRKRSRSPEGFQNAQTAKKCPENGSSQASIFGPRDLPINVVGGNRPVRWSEKPTRCQGRSRIPLPIADNFLITEATAAQSGDPGPIPDFLNRSRMSATRSQAKRAA